MLLDVAITHGAESGLTVTSAPATTNSAHAATERRRINVRLAARTATNASATSAYPRASVE